MMPRPTLPKPEEVAGIAKLLRAAGFQCFSFETTPDGCFSIRIGESESQSNVTPLGKWRADRGVS